MYFSLPVNRKELLITTITFSFVLIFIYYTITSIFALLNNRMNVVRTATADTDLADYTFIQGSSVDSQSTTTDNLAGNYTVFFNDGIMFSFDKNAKFCTEDEVIDADGKIVANSPCRGIIDVNGTKAPNQQTVCSKINGEQTKGDACVVDSPKDVYPVVFYDQGIYPATAAGKAVLYQK